MEPASIDWKRVDSRFVRDELYEHINAPKWADLTAPDDVPVDDDAWFCRPDCRHPKTADDFPKARLLRSNSELSPLGERNDNKRDLNLKKRGGVAAFLTSSPFREVPKPKQSSKKFREDLENQDPNLVGNAGKSTPPSSCSKAAPKMAKEANPPRLRSTMSARNLFAGKDILNQISEFCHEIKKLIVMRGSASPTPQEKIKKQEVVEKAENLNPNSKMGGARNDDPLKEAKKHGDENSRFKEDENLNPNSNLDDKKNGHSLKKVKKAGNKNLRLEVDENLNPYSSRDGMRTDDSLKNGKKGGDENSPLLREAVRSCPPTPQRFPSPSGQRHRSNKANVAASSPLSKPLKTRTPERGILRELVQGNEEKKTLVAMEENIASVSDEMEGKSMSVFWFLKPCTYLAK